MNLYTPTVSILKCFLLILLIPFAGGGSSITAQTPGKATNADPVATAATRIAKFTQADSLYLVENHPFWYEVLIGPIATSPKFSCELSPIPLLVKDGVYESTLFIKTLKINATLAFKPEIEVATSATIPDTTEELLLSAEFSRCFMNVGGAVVLKEQYLIHRNYVQVSAENYLPLIPSMVFSNTSVNLDVVEKAYENLLNLLVRSYPEYYSWTGKLPGIGEIASPVEGFHPFFDRITPYLRKQQDLKVILQVDASKF